MIYKIKKPKKRPYWASKDVWERTSSLVLVSLFGAHYELPVTERTGPFMALLDGVLDPWEGIRKSKRSDWRRRNLAEEGMMDIIHAIYSQVEAVAVAGASQMMAQDIQHQLEPLIRRKLHEKVDQHKQILGLSMDPDGKKEAGHG